MTDSTHTVFLFPNNYILSLFKKRLFLIMFSHKLRHKSSEDESTVYKASLLCFYLSLKYIYSDHHYDQSKLIKY